MRPGEKGRVGHMEGAAYTKVWGWEENEGPSEGQWDWNGEREGSVVEMRWEESAGQMMQGCLSVLEENSEGRHCRVFIGGKDILVAFSEL